MILLPPKATHYAKSAVRLIQQRLLNQSPP